MLGISLTAVGTFLQEFSSVIGKDKVAKGKEIKKEGSGLVLFSAINAVITISLYKYNITHFNSVEAEQLSITLILLIFFFLFAKIKSNENPLKFLRHRVFFIQSYTMGMGTVLSSFAFQFGPSSIIIAAKRSVSIFWSILAGKMYFKEKHILFKFFIFLSLLVGLVLLAL